MSYKTKAELEQELADAYATIELRDVEIASLRGDVEALKSAAPARSQVLPGGGVERGAVLHLAVPSRHGAADDRPSGTPAPDGVLEFLPTHAKGTDITFGEPFSFLLADGGYARVERLKVISQAPGVTTIEVLR